MGDYQVNILPTGVLQVRGTSGTVTIAFIAAGAPVALKRDQGGKLGPALEAEHYVTMTDGRPVRKQTREELVAELDQALGQGGSVSWQPDR